MRNEGYTKFECRWVRTPALTWPEAATQMAWRDRLKALGLMGSLPDGVGFGNLSVLESLGPRFIISGSQTGHLPHLGHEHFSRVLEVDLKGNRLTCEGPIQASSESLTHAAVYQTLPAIKAVIHVHHTGLWNRLRAHQPTTPESAEYGTPEIALAVAKLLSAPSARSGHLIVMGGHPDGLITYGTDLEEAGQALLEQLRSSPHNAKDPSI